MTENEDLQNDMEIVDGESEAKVYDPKVERRTVVDTPAVGENRRPGEQSFVFQVAVAADEFTPWGYNVLRRDLELRNFWRLEPFLASTVYTMSARLAVADWVIKGRDPHRREPKNTIRAVSRMLENADRGNGWQSFIQKIAIDLYTQDNGAFIELIRSRNRPDAPVIGVAHLDALRCYRTGDPEYPVIYEDRLGSWHKLRWWNVRAISEMPSPVENMYGAQLCAVSRCLRAAQIIRDIAVYKKEKVSGQHTKAIHIVSGVTQDNIKEVQILAQEDQLNRSLLRYTLVPILTTIDPNAQVSVATIELASLPDNFDEDVTLRWYITQIALAFGTDYQEIAPLPGGNLGSSQQSLILHMKSKGKGPALMMKLLEFVFNNTGILPPSVELEFKVLDPQLDAARAEARFNRGKDRSLRIQSQELDVDAARELAVEDGDLPEYLVEEMQKRDKERERKAEQIQQGQPPVPPPGQQEDQGNPQTVQDEQVQGGTESHNEAKSVDSRIENILLRLQKRGEIRLPEALPVLTDEELVEAMQEYSKEFTDQGPIRRLGHTLEGIIHEQFTRMADYLFQQGFLDREERITLSAAIGRALDIFGQNIPDEVAERDLDTAPRYILVQNSEM